MTSTKKTAQKTHGSSSQVLIIASSPNADAPIDASPPRSEGNKKLLFPLLTIMHPLLITLFGVLRYSYRRYRRGRHPRNCFSNISNSSGILLVHPPFSSIHLTFVFSNQIQRLPSKRARTTASPSQATQSFFSLTYFSHLTLISSFSKHWSSRKNHQSSHKMLFLTLASQHCCPHLPLHQPLMKS